MQLATARLRSMCLAGTVAALTVFSSSNTLALNLTDVPLFLQESVPPLNMIVLGRDHKLYYEAYNDASDLDGDGVLDIRYKPDEIDYFGYFDSKKCYTYASGVFEPQSRTENKQCTNQWSGDFLNYLTTTRIDALRKVLYGGYRSTDTGATTILERSHVPQDAHSWGKEYTSTAVDGYDISLYSPLSQPSASTRHLFASTTPLNTTAPLLRVLQNRSERIWNWVSIERPVAGTAIVTGVNSGGSEIRSAVTPTDYTVRVRVCVPSLLESNCRPYPNGNNKPIGLLQEFGEDDSMYFGLLSGSYAKNTSGGVLRRAVGSMRDEINTASNGSFRNFNGIIRSLNRLRVTGFGGSHAYSCGWITTRAINEGECQMWGNPVAEMMYESLRYFAGREDATSDFSITFGAGEEAGLSGGGLPVAAWDNPYTNRPVCSKPFQTVVSDINPSYDTGLPGTAFGDSAPADALGGLNVSTIGQTIWDGEFADSQRIFIGESGGVADGAPTPKTVTSFGDIRGLAPEEPTKQGSYYSASVAYHGRTTDLSTLNQSAGEVTVNSFAVALASPLPKIEIPVGGRTITLVPFAKSVAGSGISASASFQPTNQIVDFYVDTLTPTSGRFRVNFEDVEQGADHDMDAIAIYRYEVNGDSTVSITVDSEYAAGGIVQHMGYIVSGTTADGTYLVVRDRDTSAGNDVDYFLDTPPAFVGTPPAPSTGSGTWDDNVELPLTSVRTFSPGTTTAATLLKDPLWYAAKWGGFKEGDDSNDLPDAAAEWDEDGDGNPDNYFLVTNALTLGQQLRDAFNEILARVASASSASVNSGSISSETRVYQARFNSGDWTGQLLSYPVNTDGTLDAQEWDAATMIPTPANRVILTVNSDGDAVPFRWAELDDVRKAAIQPNFDADTNTTDLAIARLNYLRGADDDEVANGGTFRDRPTKLGDIVSSSPIFVGAPRFAYRDDFEDEPYSEFREEAEGRRQVVYAGANDGMLHAFDATTGAELLAFIPSPAYRHLRSLSDPSYSHKFFVDGAPNVGDVFINDEWESVLVGGLNKGGQGIYALKITDPATFSEANADSIVMWEFTDADDADLGYTYSQPAIVRLPNGSWGAIFGNGYDNTDNDSHISGTGNAVLFIVDIASGSVIAKLDTGAGTAEDPTGQGRPNGLSTPAVVDLNGDSIVDYVFAGDLHGNMWKFDIRNADPAVWDVAFEEDGDPLPFFAAGATDRSIPQPITSRPEVIRGPRGVGMTVLFGTGKYIETDDKIIPGTPEIQAYYGLWDRNNGARIESLAQLLEQEIIFEGTVEFDGSDRALRATTQYPFDPGTHRGWYIDLLSPSGYQAERQVSNTAVRAGRAIFTTLIPDADPCNAGGNSWLMELDARTGNRLAFTPFDLNNDGLFDENDYVEVPGVGMVPVSGLQPDVGITPEPGILLSGDGTAEYKYNPGTTGSISVTVENPGEGASGRQSWRQIR